MRISGRKLLSGVLLCALAVLLSGCFLKLLIGRVFVRTVSEEVEQIIAAVFSNTTTAVCSEEEIINEAGQVVTDVECTYVIASEESSVPDVTSTVELISEFGIVGVLIDPLILQVPNGATNFAGTFDDGSGPAAIVITEAASFKADVVTEVFPESGEKFVILEFPSLPADGTTFSFYLEFELPALAAVDVKPMFAGKVEVDGDTFYPPLLPCLTNFADVPAVTIPVSDNPQTLIFQIADLIDVPCDNQVYVLMPDVDGTLRVAIDIKPGSDPNSINLQSRGVIPVAILTTPEFDATTVDPSTVRFGPGAAARRHQGHVEDVNHDGLLDLVLHFPTQQTGIQCGETEAVLTGQTFGGEAIEGSDAINIVKC